VCINVIQGTETSTLAGYVTVFVTQKRDKKTRQDAQVMQSSFL